MQGPNRAGDTLDQGTQQRDSLGRTDLAERCERVMQIVGMIDLLREQITFVPHAELAAMQDDEWPRRRQAAFAKALAVDPGAQRGRRAEEGRERIFP